MIEVRLAQIVTTGLLILSPVIGLVSIGFSVRSIAKALGLWVLGLLTGVSGLIASLWVANAMHRVAEANGERILNDMPLYGQVLTGALGLAGFGIAFVLIFVVGVIARLLRKYSAG